MRYRVHGTSRTTGAQSTLLVEAKNHEAARALASQRLVVGQVEPEGGLAEPEIFERPEKSDMEQLIEAVGPGNREPAHDRNAASPKMRLRRRLFLCTLVIVFAILVLAIWLKLRR